MICPNEPTGNSSLASWCRKLVRWCRSLELQSGVGYRVKKGTNGTTLELEHTPAGKAAANKRMRVKEVLGNYLVCHAYDGTEDTATDIMVAKLPDLRHSITTQTLAGKAVTMSGYAISGGVCTRTVTGSDATQTEMVLPIWQLGTQPDSEIWPIKPDGGTGVTTTESATATVEWLLIDNRAWCQTG